MALLNLPLNAAHLERHLAEEDDVGAQARAAGAAAHLVEAAIDGAIFDRRPAALGLAVRLVQFAVHVHHASGAGALVQVVDILRAEKEAVAQLRFQLGEGDVRRIGLGHSPAARRLE